MKGEYMDLQGEHQMQQSLAGMMFLIIDEMSMIGMNIFGQVDKCLLQVFPHQADQLFGGCSCLPFGDFGQLLPVIVSRFKPQCPARPCQTLAARHISSETGNAGQDKSRVLFCCILCQLRDCQVTTDDRQHLMKHTPAQVQDIAPFSTALHLHPTVEAVVEHNVTRVRANGQPIATIKAVHTGPNASKASPDDAAGLEPVICVAHEARVMLTANLWVDVGPVNGAMGTVVATCYKSGQCPPHLPVAVMVHFDSYSGPTFADGTVPITPICHTWSASGAGLGCHHPQGTGYDTGQHRH